MGAGETGIQVVNWIGVFSTSGSVTVNGSTAGLSDYLNYGGCGLVTVAVGSSPVVAVTPTAGFAVKKLIISEVDAMSGVAYPVATIPVHLPKGQQFTHTWTGIAASTRGYWRVEAEFGSYYTVTSSADGDGTLSPLGETNVGEYGAIRFFITPNAGHRGKLFVDDVYIGSRAESTYDLVNITADHSVYVSFEPITHTVTATAGANGTITPNGVVTVNECDSATFAIAANTGYVIENVIVDGVSIGAVSSVTFSNITANHNVSASFIAQPPDTCTITSDAGTGGSIAPQGSISVYKGASQGFNITAYPGYRAKRLVIDGDNANLPPGVTAFYYTFTNVQTDHSIVAVFDIYNHTITSSAGEHGTITPLGETTVADRDSQAYAITPDAGYAVKTLLVDGVAVARATAFTFESVTADHSISVTFGADVTGGVGGGDGIPDDEQSPSSIRHIWQAAPLGKTFGHIRPLGV